MATIRGWSDDERERRAQSLASIIRRAWRSIARSVASFVASKTFVTESDVGAIPDEWSEQLDSLILDFVEIVYKDSAGRIVEQLNPPEDLILRNDVVAAYLQEVKNRLVGIGDDIWLIARDQIVEGVRKGESIPEISERVRNVTGVSDSRALVIARTEVHAAHEAGSFAQASSLDPNGTKTWLSTNDDRTRPTHRIADNQEVPMSEPFDVGGEPLRYPGDVFGAPQETINCRCTALYDISDSLISDASLREGPAMNLPAKRKAAASRIYSPSLTDGDIIAESSDGSLRLRWSAERKRVLLESGTVGGSWAETEELTKKAAYQRIRMGHWFQPDNTPVTAATTPHTGSMLALVPTEEDARRLAVDGGEPWEDLHLTLGYFGEADLIPDEVRTQLMAMVSSVAEEMPTIVCNGFAVSSFNPGTETACAVLVPSGGNLEHAYREFMEEVPSIFAESGMSMRTQHSPWIPHVTLKYTQDTDVSDYASRIGPLTFDRVRLAFGEQVYDMPLSSFEDAAYPEESVWDGILSFDENGDPLVPNVLIPLEALQERDVNVPGGPGHSLREYWVRGPGAARIRWGTDGSMSRCIRYLSEYVRNPGGLCAEYHRAATGEWPRGGNVPSESDTVVLSENMVYAAEESIAEVEVPDMVEECPPGSHRMPDGECMPDEDMVRMNDATWEGILTVEGIESGDGRMFAPNALTWDEPPLPLMWEKETSHGGRNSVSVRVGSIDRIWREPDPTGRRDVYVIKGVGTIDLGSQDGQEVYRRMRRGYMRGNSVDVDSVKGADVQLVYPESSEDAEDLFSAPELTVFTRGRIRATTLVEIPAFTEARLSLIDSEPMVTAATQAFEAVPVHETGWTDDPWDSAEILRRLSSPMTLETARNVFAWIDEDLADENGELPQYAGKLPHHEVSADGVPGAANLTACSAAIAALHGARGGVDIPEDQRRSTYDHLAAHLRDAGRTPPAFDATEETMSGLVAATSVIEISDTPPREWFNEPTDVTPSGALTVTSEGRIYGYVAPADVRHRSFMDRAVYAPRKKVDYERFMGGETIVSDGGRVRTGNITMNCGHASTAVGLNASQATEHYDNTCSVVATVRVGENRNGTWFAGALLPDVTPEQVRRVMACRLSGDWRAHLDKPGWREFVAALLVPVPGFPMARTAPSVQTTEGELVASSVPVQFVVQENPITTISSVRKSLEDRVAALRTSVTANVNRTRVDALKSRLRREVNNGM